MLRILSLLIFLLPTFSYAQTYPVFESVYVNDLAGIINDEDEANILSQLETLFNDHGVEATVLTIDSRKAYGDSNSIESFSTGLFNKWGVGNVERNDGILILIARNDREMRVELGTGYGDDFNFAAGDVIDQNFLPSFRNDKYSQGIRLGTTEVIRRIALPLAEGQEKPADAKDKGQNTGIIAMFIGVIGLVLFSFKRFFSDLFIHFRKCPNCGRKGLQRSRRTLSSATTTSTGKGVVTTSCEYCSYKDVDEYTTPRRSSSRSSSRSGFGGGRSSGGGASGRW